MRLPSWQFISEFFRFESGTNQDLLVLVLLFLPGPDLIRASRVCRRWHLIFARHSGLFWEHLCINEQHGMRLQIHLPSGQSQLATFFSSSFSSSSSSDEASASDQQQHQPQLFFDAGPNLDVIAPSLFSLADQIRAKQHDEQSPQPVVLKNRISSNNSQFRRASDEERGILALMWRDLYKRKCEFDHSCWRKPRGAGASLVQGHFVSRNLNQMGAQVREITLEEFDPTHSFGCIRFVPKIDRHMSDLLRIQNELLSQRTIHFQDEESGEPPSSDASNGKIPQNPQQHDVNNSKAGGPSLMSRLLSLFSRWETLGTRAASSSLSESHDIESQHDLNAQYDIFHGSRPFALVSQINNHEMLLVELEAGKAVKNFKSADYRELGTTDACFLIGSHSQPSLDVDDCILTSSRDGLLSIWGLSSSYPRKVWRAHDSICYGVRCTADSQTALSVCHDTSLKLWDISSERCLQQNVHRHTKIIYGCRTDGFTTFFTFSKDGSIKCWDIRVSFESGEVHQWCHPTSTPIYSMGISGYKICSGSQKSVMFWDLRKSLESVAHHRIEDHVTCMEMDELKCVCLSTSQKMRVYDAHSFELVHELINSPVIEPAVFEETANASLLLGAHGLGSMILLSMK